LGFVFKNAMVARNQRLQIRFCPPRRSTLIIRTAEAKARLLGPSWSQKTGWLAPKMKPVPAAIAALLFLCATSLISASLAATACTFNYFDAKDTILIQKTRYNRSY
jgi:hypothetical protein